MRHVLSVIIVFELLNGIKIIIIHINLDEKNFGDFLKMFRSMIKLLKLLTGIQIMIIQTNLGEKMFQDF